MEQLERALKQNAILRRMVGQIPNKWYTIRQTVNLIFISQIGSSAYRHTDFQSEFMLKLELLILLLLQTKNLEDMLHPVLISPCWHLNQPKVEQRKLDLTYLQSHPQYSDTKCSASLFFPSIRPAVTVSWIELLITGHIISFVC